MIQPAVGYIPHASSTIFLQNDLLVKIACFLPNRQLAIFLCCSRAINNLSFDVHDAHLKKRFNLLRNQFVAPDYADFISKQHRHRPSRIYAAACCNRIGYCSDPVAIFRNYGGAVSCITMPTQDRIVAGSIDGALRVWGVNSGSAAPLRILKGHTHPILCVSALADRWIVSGSEDCSVRVWDVNSGSAAPLHVLNGHTDWVKCVTVLTDGRIVSGSMDGTLSIWDVNSGSAAPLQVLNGHEGAVLCVTVLADGRIVSGGEDCTLRIWDIRIPAPALVLRGHLGAVKCVIASADDCIVSGSEDCTVCVWKMDIPKLIAEIGGPPPALRLQRRWEWLRAIGPSITSFFMKFGE